ncbi:MAG: hypothetical protein CO187_07785 [Zetaproteobacteria bacterium CG_4_9_14_3_um_filter_53_7]|nr:MAG: hypothetical protein CO187_07785 [Zetaproteobacteria bacterium CG_4_9_14_3_um_filter_53_7]
MPLKSPAAELRPVAIMRTLPAKISRTGLPDVAQGKPEWIDVYGYAKTGIIFSPTYAIVDW